MNIVPYLRTGVKQKCFKCIVTVICGFWRLVDFHVYKIPTNRLIGLWEFFDAVILY